MDNIVLQSLDNSMNNTNSMTQSNQPILNQLDNIDINAILEQLDLPIPMLFSPSIN